MSLTNKNCIISAAPKQTNKSSQSEAYTPNSRCQDKIRVVTTSSCALHSGD